MAENVARYDEFFILYLFLSYLILFFIIITFFMVENTARYH